MNVKPIVLSQTEWQSMLGKDEQMQPGFADFQNFAQGFGFDTREAIFQARNSKNPTRWDFAKTVAQGWFE